MYISRSLTKFKTITPSQHSSGYSSTTYHPSRITSGSSSSSNLFGNMNRKENVQFSSSSWSLFSSLRKRDLRHNLCLPCSSSQRSNNNNNPLVAFAGYNNGDSDNFIDTYFDTWTKKIIAINILTFIAGKFNPAIVHMGAKVDYKIYYGDWYRLFTPIFLHGNLQHLAINCYSMNSIGGTMESIMSPRTFLATYFISGITGNLLSYYVGSAPRAVGSSTGIAGLLGALGIYAVRHRGILRTDYMMRGVMQTIVLNIWSGLSSSRIDNMGHLGGLLGGAAACYLIGPRYRRRRPPFTGLENKPLLQDTFNKILGKDKQKSNNSLSRSNNGRNRQRGKNGNNNGMILKYRQNNQKNNGFFFVNGISNKLPFFGRKEMNNSKWPSANAKSDSIEQTLKELKQANQQVQKWDGFRKQFQGWVSQQKGKPTTNPPKN